MKLCETELKRSKNIILCHFMVDGSFPTALLVCELVPGALDGRKWMYIPMPPLIAARTPLL